MKPEIKQKWITALRDGSYKKITGFIRKNDCFCAQGVLCDIYSKEKGIEWKLDIGHSGRFSIHDSWRAAPSFVWEWAGVEFIYDNQLKKDQVVWMNDQQNNSFSEIADWIEREF